MCCAVIVDIVVIIHWKFLCNVLQQLFLKLFFYKVMELNADNAAVYSMLNGNCSLYNSISCGSVDFSQCV